MPNQQFGPGGAFVGDPVNLMSGTVTANGSGAGLPCSSYTTARLTLTVTAATGTTPSMTVTVETSGDGTTGWASVGAFAAKTAPGTERKTVSGLDNYVRVSWAVTGTTPSFTASVAGVLL